MFHRALLPWAWAFLTLASSFIRAQSAEATFTVATFNLENYVEAATSSRPPKSPEAKAKIRESIRTMRPDVLALQEIGTTNALLELRATLAAEGMEFPYWEHVSGRDTNIFVAVLSRFPISARRPHSAQSYLLHGRRMHVSRGFAEVDIRVNANYTFTLLAAHLKSRLDSALADQAEIRLEEARLLREIIDARLRTNPDVNLVVLGDFNDTKDAESTRLIMGPRGRTALLDTRPAERRGGAVPETAAPASPRTVTWTYHYGKEDTYSRIDYIFLSRGMAREWKSEDSYVLSQPGWGFASDHRPVLASFTAMEK